MRGTSRVLVASCFLIWVLVIVVVSTPNYYKAGCLTLPVLEARVRNQVVSRAWLPLKIRGTIRSLLFQLLVAPAASCGRTSPFGASVFTWPSPLYLRPLLFLTRTLVIGFRTHPGWSHLKILNLIISLKTMSLPNKILFTGSQRHFFLRATMQPTHQSYLGVKFYPAMHVWTFLIICYRSTRSYNF